jgi:hypothetical protein
VLPPLAVADLLVGVDLSQKQVGLSGDQFSDAHDFDDVRANADDLFRHDGRRLSGRR